MSLTRCRIKTSQPLQLWDEVTASLNPSHDSIDNCNRAKIICWSVAFGLKSVMFASCGVLACFLPLRSPTCTLRSSCGLNFSNWHLRDPDCHLVLLLILRMYGACVGCIYNTIHEEGRVP